MVWILLLIFSNRSLNCSSIDLSKILDRHAYSSDIRPKSLLDNVSGQTSEIIPHGGQVHFMTRNAIDCFA